jgi:hypothetical protein
MSRPGDSDRGQAIARLGASSLLHWFRVMVRACSSLSGSLVSVNRNLAGMKYHGCVCANWSVGYGSAAAADLVAIIGERDAGSIHQKRSSGLAD